MEDKKIFLLPPLIGGIITVFGTNLPPFALLNLFFFFWFIFGGAIAYILASKKPSYIEQKYDGAIYGFFSGLFGWFFHSVFIFFLYLKGKFRMDILIDRLNEFPVENKEEIINQLMNTGIVKILILGTTFLALIYLIFGTLGGILGKKLYFSKNKTKNEKNF